LFSTVTDQQVTFVNAPGLAAERGLQTELITLTESPNHRSLVDVRVVAPDGSAVNVAGTLSGPQEVEKVVQINGRSFDLRAEGEPDPALLRPAWGARQDRHAARRGRRQHPGRADEPGHQRQGRDGDAAAGSRRAADVRAAIGAAVGATTLEVVDLS
jgi:D-3-phosphoglycerate dehydrogenase